MCVGGGGGGTDRQRSYVLSMSELFASVCRSVCLLLRFLSACSVLGVCSHFLSFVSYFVFGESRCRFFVE